MSNWGAPQWVILFFLIVGELQSICRNVDVAIKADEEFAERAIRDRRNWQGNIFSHAVWTLIIAYTLAKGGFW